MDEETQLSRLSPLRTLSSGAYSDDNHPATSDGNGPKVVPGWPTKPQKLQRFDASFVLSLVSDVVLLIIALAFFGENSLREAQG